MTVKEELHRLIDDLPEDLANQARVYLNFLRSTETWEERAARVQSAYGSMAHLPGSVDDYLQEKQEEIELEEEQAERLMRGVG
jgi:hypothetical protein